MAENHKFHYGGQAVIEGVMIRGEKYMVTAVRMPDQTIHIDKKPLPQLYTGKLRKAPLIRGIIVLIESMVLGIQTLMHSADLAIAEVEPDKAKKGKKDNTGWIVWGTMLVSMVFAVALFFLAPLFLTRLLHIGNTFLFNVVEGLIRIAMFILYIRLVSLMPDIKRVFAYHGAEHKSVNGYEGGSPMEPEALKKFSKAHVRCGGSFLFVVLIIAIIVFSIVGALIGQVLWALVLSRIILVPVIAALGYEVIYFGARHTENIFVKIILAPGMWLQSMTTREPDNWQLEVAIAAMKTAIEADQGIVAAPAVETTPAETPPPAVNS